MVEHCNGPVIVLADSSKLGTVSNFSTVAIDKISVLITDKNADPHMVEEFCNVGVKVYTA
jgi:DeoR/GlpR family transcriptional regulator of sugar metabolism